MPQILADTIGSKTPDQLYKMVESGWNSTVARAELISRDLPIKRPKVAKSGRGARTLHAKGKSGVTGGYVRVDAGTHVVNLRAPRVGQRVEPWIANATGRGDL